MTKKKVTFRPKSEWQKDECLFCSKPAVVEAVSGHAFIRSCNDASCKDQAEAVALATGHF